MAIGGVNPVTGQPTYVSYFEYKDRRGRIVPYQLRGLDILLHIANNQARAELGIPGMFARTADGRVYLTPNFINSVGYRAQIDLQKMVVGTLERGSQNTFDLLRILGEALKVESQDSTHLLRAHKELAQEMRKALINRYGTGVEQRKQVPSYPRRSRLSGHLRRAISQPDMVQATPKGINYINQDRLNIEARHWQRINFGVRPAPGARRAAVSKPPQQFDVRLGGGRVGGRSIGKVGFRAKPRPPMYLPPGFWTFVGGRTSRDERRERTSLEADDRSERLERAAERRAARMAARRGEASAEQTTVARSDRYGVSPYYRVFRRESGGQSPWRRNYGPIRGEQTYTRRYTSQFLGERKRKVTRRTGGSSRFSQQAFWPRPSSRGSTGKRFPTAGVVASNFMDAGFRAFSDKVDLAYLRYASAVQADAERTAEGRAVKRVILKYRPDGVNLGSFLPK